ncbi:uncharacterized protein ACLA_030800 [Aspergillus clavatus NRRL 1]|uniref:Uncharacterized protein n=1 Tax=Aspergillus clavatus (strain ATCC 1007 / CBS 513.65 / DSM 816 / NCTC 3887 / NRRL 1 / QM 1276 / 107) TaxID=344612 RepID=A1CRS6_ASPCL|nr:uncharacterized protein ACLA_030800 [Aspergillus clavatus NRRL 1]EAW08347.1 hypothetical protein ACLA_030800 [Aspergillus clavatus NRRL 1]
MTNPYNDDLLEHAIYVVKLVHAYDQENPDQFSTERLRLQSTLHKWFDQYRFAVNPYNGYKVHTFSRTLIYTEMYLTQCAANPPIPIEFQTDYCGGTSSKQCLLT